MIAIIAPLIVAAIILHGLRRWIELRVYAAAWDVLATIESDKGQSPPDA